MRKCCRTLLLGVQISRETSTNIAQYLYLSYSPDHMHEKFKSSKIVGSQNSRKRKRQIINLLLDIFV